MYEHNENTRFGLSYRLRSAQRAKGDFYVSGSNPAFNGKSNVWANPDLPETITLSGYHRYKKVGFSGTARWTHWTSSFPDFSVYSDAPLMKYVYSTTNGTKVSHYDYDNTWTLTAGLDYYYCKNLTFRFGAGWDESPTHSDNKRTIRIPDNDRWWTSIGASYIKNNWQLDIGYAHMFGKTGKALEASDPSSVQVKYKNMQSHILGIQYQYKF
jgi:long-chain fatty acid transport protein